MKLLTLVLALFLAPVSMNAQAQTFWVSSFSGTTLSDKLTNAMVSCTSQSPCTILINSSFPIISGQSLPSPCANCTFRDYRYVNLGGTSAMNVGTTSGTVAAGDDSRFSAGSIPSGLVMFVDGTISACPSGYTQVSSSGNYILLTTAANNDAGTTGGSNSYTPAGTNGTVAFTPAGTNGTVSFTPAGTNGTSTVTPQGTNNAPAISWPAGVPTFAGNAGTVPAQTVSWPAGVPTFTGSALGTHSHGAGTLADATSGSTVKLFTSSASGVSAATLSGSTAAVTAGTPAGTVAWPAGVPTNSTVSFTPAGTVAWPAGVPTHSAATFTGSSSTVAAQTFTGSAGTVPAETFTGSSGTVPAETFTGTPATLVPTYLKLIPCRKN